MIEVLTIGTATRDVFVQGDFFRVVHDPKHLRKAGFPTGEAQCFAVGLGGKVEVKKPIFTVGGGATNTAVTFTRQGFKTEALIKIGRDGSGDDILDSLKKEKVRPIAVFDRDLGTAYSLVLLSLDGERTILNYRGASKDLLLSEIPKREFTADFVYLVPGAIQVSVIAKIIRKLKKRGAIIAMNPSRHYIELGPKKLKPIFDNLDIIILNREEGSYLTGVKHENERGIFKKFDELVGGLAVMTDGPKGVMVSDGRKIYRASIYKEKKLVDRTGAGDAFGSGFYAGLLRQVSGIRYQVSNSRKIPVFSEKDIVYGIKLGSANATAVVEKIGAQPGILTKREFETQERWKNLRVKVGKV